MGNTQSSSFIGKYYPEFYLTDAVEKWRKRTILSMEKCQKCSLALLCGGVCGFCVNRKK